MRRVISPSFPTHQILPEWDCKLHRPPCWCFSVWGVGNENQQSTVLKSTTFKIVKKHISFLRLFSASALDFPLCLKTPLPLVTQSVLIGQLKHVWTNVYANLYANVWLCDSVMSEYWRGVWGAVFSVGERSFCRCDLFNFQDLFNVEEQM